MAAPILQELTNCKSYIVYGSDKIQFAYWNPGTKMLHHYGKGRNFISTVGCKKDPTNGPILGLAYLRILKETMELPHLY